jgi:glycerol uptake facilitator-like aquaporin
MRGVIIYHNPECGTSRNTLALIRNAGIKPASAAAFVLAQIIGALLGAQVWRWLFDFGPTD